MTDTTISAEDLVSTYESLIKKGILRATGPVEYDRGGCLKCGNVDDHGTQWKSWKYCPKCGGSIKATMSTTNDEQAKYGDQPKIIGAPVDQKTVGEMKEEMIEAIDRLSEQVKPKEREPMMPILTTYDEHKSKYGMLGRELYFIDGWGKGADAYRTAMDELITTGKLRVVVEVDAPLEQVDMDKWWTCSGCNESFLSYHDQPNYCPGCGNKIKR